MQCSTMGCAAWDSWCWGPRHISTGAYSGYTCQLGSFEGNLLWAFRGSSAIQTKPRAAETIRGFASKARSHPNRSTTVDIAAYTQFSWANKRLMSRFAIGMERLLTLGGAHPSTNCRYPPKSRSLPQLHLLVRLQLSRARTPPKEGEMLLPKDLVSKAVVRLPGPPRTGGVAHATLVACRPPQHTGTPSSYPRDPYFHTPLPHVHPERTILLSTYC